MKKLTKLDRKEFYKIITSGNQQYIARFKKDFKGELEAFTSSIASAYDSYKILSQNIQSNERRGHIAAYIYKAINDLVGASHIFLLGYITPSGNLMRHFHESIAMSILLSYSEKHYDCFQKDKAFKVSRVFDLINKNHALFKFNGKSWATFVQIKNVYHAFSHSTRFAIGCLAIQEKGGGNIMGGFFDAGKKRQYKLELKRMISSADCLKNVIGGISNAYTNL